MCDDDRKNLAKLITQVSENLGGEAMLFDGSDVARSDTPKKETAKS